MTTTNTTTTSNGEAHAKSLTAEEIETKRRKLWADYDEAAAFESEAEAELEDAQKAKSDVIAAIVAEYGQNEFERKGRKIAFAKRKGKDSYFEKNKKTLQIVDE